MRPTIPSTRSAKPPIGTTFAFSLSTAASVSVAFTQPAPGRVSHGRCVAPSARNSHGHRCTRTLTKGTLSLAGHAGTNHLSFQGRLSRSRRLARGSYTLVLVAADAFGQRSATRRISFKITG